MTVSVEETPTTFEAPSREPAAAGIRHAFLADFARYRDYQPDRSALTLMLLNQGLWALLQYGVAHALVTRDVAPNAVVLGNPASVVSFEGSHEYLSPH